MCKASQQFEQYALSIAIYKGNPNIGVNAMIISADITWNPNDELRALESFITQIKAINRKKNIAIAVRNRIELFKIALRIPSDDVNGFSTISHKFQLHCKAAIATCVKSPVSIVSQKI